MHNYISKLGNSIVVNVLEKILNNLLNVEKFLEQSVNISYKDYLDEEYDVDEVVLTEKQLQKVKGIGSPKYSFGGKVIDGDIYNTITASYGKISGNSGKIPCKEGYRILTPRETWRLMGFDNEDFDRAASVNSKTQLYKQAGNSIVVPVLEKILYELFEENKLRR